MPIASAILIAITMAMPIARGPGPEARILLYISAAFSAQARGARPPLRSAMAANAPAGAANAPAGAPNAPAGAANAIVVLGGMLSYECRIVRSGTIDDQGRFRPDEIGMVLLTRASDDEHRSTEPILVLSIEPGGIVDQWNTQQRAAGDVFIQPGDRLVAVNGHVPHDIMRAELRWQRAVVLDFLRPAPRLAG